MAFFNTHVDCFPSHSHSPVRVISAGPGVDRLPVVVNEPPPHDVPASWPVDGGLQQHDVDLVQVAAPSVKPVDVDDCILQGDVVVAHLLEHLQCVWEHQRSIKKENPNQYSLFAGAYRPCSFTTLT